MTGEKPQHDKLERMAGKVSRERLVRALADYAAELLDEGISIDDVWAAVRVVCHDLGIDPDELWRSRH
jgi:hypothetical protein